MKDFTPASLLRESTRVIEKKLAIAEARRTFKDGYNFREVLESVEKASKRGKYIARADVQGLGMFSKDDTIELEDIQKYLEGLGYIVRLLAGPNVSLYILEVSWNVW